MDYFGFLKQPKRNAGTNTLIENNQQDQLKISLSTSNPRHDSSPLQISFFFFFFHFIFVQTQSIFRFESTEMKMSSRAPLLISNTEVSLFMTNRQLKNWVYYAFSLCFFHASLMSFVSLKKRKKNTMHASSVLLGLMTLFCGKTCIFQCDIIQICLQRFSDYKL